MFKRISILSLALCTAGQLPAQTAVIEGVVTGVEDSSVIPHALVRLQSGEANDWIVRQQTITNSNGRFRFAEVAPGTYRVQLLRIGYQPALSDIVRVTKSTTSKVDFRAPAQVVVLATMSVYANPTCLSQDRLSSDPRLAELWREARTGVETRRAFDYQYSYRRALKQNVILERRLGGRKHQSTVATVVNDPDSVASRDARRQARNREQGYAAGTSITMPDEKEILDEAFLTTHCLETAIDEQGGAVGFRFRPLKRRRDIADVRGRVWVDAITYQVRRLEVEYLRDEKAFADAAVDYADIVIEGKPMRLPANGVASLRPTGVAGAIVKRATSRFTYTYDSIASRSR